MRSTLGDRLKQSEKERAIRRTLLGYLEFEPSGQIENAGLTFEQEVQYKIALSLKNISDRLERMADEGRL